MQAGEIMEYHIGDIITVKVTSIENYGIFVKVDEKYNGLIHISQISKKYVSNVRNYAFVGENILAKIVDIDYKKNQFNLSIKSIDYRIEADKKEKVLESPNGFKKLKENLPIWVEKKLKEINFSEKE